MTQRQNRSTFPHGILNYLCQLPHRVGFQDAVTRGTQYYRSRVDCLVREVIHLQNLLLELRGCNFPIPFTKPQVVCRTTFEDNTACIEVAQSDHKIRPKNKHAFFTFVTTSIKGSLQLSMSHQNISSPIFLRNPCPVTNTCAYTIKSWGGRQLHLLNTRECEVIVGSAFK